ncbi:MAG: isoamylase early set domain-containing protein [Phycisphaerae bacterium]|nr:isoamylase early set domain-containing protein [Phycisphaerae bacterium]
MVTIKPNGRVEFRFFARGARRVQVVGEFTDWLAQPIEMSPGADGWWRLSTPVPVGEHRFRYLIDGRHWMTDFAAFGVAPNKFGQFDSMLVVTKRAPRVPQPIAAS